MICRETFPTGAEFGAPYKALLLGLCGIYKTTSHRCLSLLSRQATKQ